MDCNIDQRGTNRSQSQPVLHSLPPFELFSCESPADVRKYYGHATADRVEVLQGEKNSRSLQDCLKQAITEQVKLSEQAVTAAMNAEFVASPNPTVWQPKSRRVEK